MQLNGADIGATVSGNTGSGMLLDMAYLARHLLRKKGMGHAEMIGVLLVPADRS